MPEKIFKFLNGPLNVQSGNIIPGAEMATIQATAAWMVER
jgi:hypothetical protein